MYSNGYNVYKNNSINYASKEQLLLMLVDGAVKFTKIARQAILDKDVKKAHENLKKTQDIFVELIVTLDVSKAEWMTSLLEVYKYIKDKLFEANIKKDINMVDEILPLIESVNNLWHDAYKVSKGSK
ncbi:flagellar export chaperone FliS [Clostridium sp.]|uniref:flagellar export chaperone FliS n=1 Tax=Clostridium sp. TaxID=1506 RepID=UPI002629BD0E|nr:flagellar export chaperone FliS [Clostridium sp.]